MSTGEPNDDDLRATAHAAGLALDVVGQGPAVLCLHSSGLSRRQWRRLADELASSHRVLVPDLLGYGESQVPTDLDNFDTEEDLASLRPLLRTLNGPVALVGHSYGGYLALQLAIERNAVDPRSVAAVAVYEPVTFGALRASETLGLPADPAEAEIISEDEFFSLDEGYEGWLRRFVGWWNGPGAWDEIRPEVKAAFRASQEKMHREVWALTRNQPPLEQYEGIEAPCLFLHGAETREAAKAVCRRVADVLPRPTIVAVDGAGHMGPLSHRTAVNDAIADHLRITRTD